MLLEGTRREALSCFVGIVPARPEPQRSTSAIPLLPLPRVCPATITKSVDRRHCAPAPDRSRPAQRRWCRQAVWAGRAPFSLNRLSLSTLLPQGSHAHPAPHAHPHAFPVR